MQWKAVRGFEQRYAVSDTGELKNTQRNTLVKPTTINSGYLLYRLYDKGKCSHKLAHILVAEAFIPNPQNKRTVNHKDCDKHNNNLNNLEWMTHGENHAHAFQHGRRNPTAFQLGINKLTVEEIVWVRKHYLRGDKTYGAGPLARRFNVSTPTLLKIVRGQSYKSIPLEDIC